MLCSMYHTGIKETKQPIGTTLLQITTLLIKKKKKKKKSLRP